MVGSQTGSAWTMGRPGFQQYELLCRNRRARDRPRPPVTSIDPAVSLVESARAIGHRASAAGHSSGEAVGPTCVDQAIVICDDLIDVEHDRGGEMNRVEYA